MPADEDRKNHERMQGLIDQLQGRIRSYKKQIEEAEEIAALNLAKYRQAQGQLGESEERADLNEQALAKYKAKERACSLAPMVRNIICQFSCIFFDVPLCFVSVNTTASGRGHQQS